MPIVPAPAPLAELPAPMRPRAARRKGVPLAVVALVAGGLLLGGGVGIFLLSRAAGGITGQLKLSDDGADVLALHCDPRRCKDGTTVDLDGARAVFAGGDATLPVVRQLSIGDNPLALHVVRAGASRDETVQLVVPVAYRVWADLSAMSSDAPAIVIRVQAAPSSQVSIDGKPIKLDAKGDGASTIDEAAATAGPADESRTVSVQAAYSITLAPGSEPHPPQTGSVAARVSIAPLRIDVPGTHGVVDKDRVLLAGRAARGATVTVDGAPVSVAPDGSFESMAPLAALGEHTLRVRTSSPQLSGRTVNVDVKRVASLAQEAKALDQRRPLTFDAVNSNLAASVGQPIAVDGEVVDARGSGHRSILLVDDRRGCKKGPCLARVVAALEVAPQRGTFVKAYGRVAPPFASPSGQSVLEVEADFLIASKK
jgi:hypothetical protein